MGNKKIIHELSLSRILLISLFIIATVQIVVFLPTPSASSKANDGSPVVKPAIQEINLKPSGTALKENYVMLPKAIPYDWLDASIGTRCSLAGEDDNQQKFFLPFNFTFYDMVFTSFYVDTNGYISFSQGSYYNNEPFPVTNPQYMISPFWKDLIADDPCNIYVVNFTSPDMVVIEWKDYRFREDNTIAGTFEIILVPNGDIIFNYDYLFETRDATIGLNYGPDAGMFSQFSDFNIKSIEYINDYTILFTKGNIMINELSNTADDYIEIYNDGPAIDMTNWYLEIYYDNSYSYTYWFPENWIFEAYSFVVINENGDKSWDTNTELFTEFDIPWEGNVSLACSLFSSRGENIDWVEANGFNGSRPPGAAWVNDTTLNFTGQYIQRIDINDTDHASDWGVYSSGTSGDYNFGQDVDPIVLIEAKPMTVKLGEPVQFHFIGRAGNKPASFYWDFGDGYISNSIDPFHYYSSPGFYWVSLTVQDNEGDMGYVSIQNLVEVRDTQPPWVSEGPPDYLDIARGWFLQFNYTINDDDSYNGSYELYRNEELIDNGTWTVRDRFSIDIDTNLKEGEYNFRLVFKDDDGNYGNDHYSRIYIHEDGNPGDFVDFMSENGPFFGSMAGIGAVIAIILVVIVKKGRGGGGGGGDEDFVDFFE
ncbi:MAG: PKD domain-containing protein [Promethearchaeota archaeon]